MKRRVSYRRSVDKGSGIDKLLSLPGIKEAIALVKEHAFFLAMDETLGAAIKGELGDDLRQLLNEESYEALDKFFQNELVESFTADTEDEILEGLAIEAGPKIVELWELSEPAGERLSEFIYWGENPSLYIAQPYWLPFVLVVNAKKPEAMYTLRKKYFEFLRKNSVVVPPEGMKDGHIYLDVTYLPYKALLLAYGAVLFCRKQLKIRKQDLREGALPSADAEKALKCVELQRSKGSKEAAKELGFRIYASDNPSGSYPSFRKYLKLGRLIERKLDMLDVFLSNLEDNLKKV